MRAATRRRTRSQVAGEVPMCATAAAATSALLPIQPDAMTAAQLPAVSHLARYCRHAHQLVAAALRRWFGCCETNALDPLAGIQRAQVELYIRHLHESGLRDSSVNTMMHGVRGFFRFAHIDGLITADSAVYARLPKVHADETRTQGLDRLRVLEACRSQRTQGPLVLRPTSGKPFDRRGAHFLTAYVAEHERRGARRYRVGVRQTAPLARGLRRFRAAGSMPSSTSARPRSGTRASVRTSRTMLRYPVSASTRRATFPSS